MSASPSWGAIARRWLVIAAIAAARAVAIVVAAVVAVLVAVGVIIAVTVAADAMPTLAAELPHAARRRHAAVAKAPPPRPPRLLRLPPPPALIALVSVPARLASVVKLNWLSHEAHSKLDPVASAL